MISFDHLGAWFVQLFLQPLAYLAGLLFCVGFGLIVFKQISTVFHIKRRNE